MHARPSHYKAQQIPHFCERGLCNDLSVILKRLLGSDLLSFFV